MKKSILMRGMPFAAGLLTAMLPAAPSSAAPEVSGPTPLAAAVNAALARHAGLAAASAQAEQARARRREASAMRLPNVAAESRFTRGDHPVYVFGSLLEQGRFGPQHFATDFLNDPGDLTNIKSSLRAGLPLFTAFDITSAEREGRQAELQAESGREGLSQQLRLQAAMTYLQLLMDRDLKAMLQERIDASTREVDDARRLKERGLVLGSDYFAAEAILSGLKAWFTQVEADQQAAFHRLETLTGRPGIVVAGDPTDRPYRLPPLEDARRTGLEKRPDLQAARVSIEMAALRHRQAGRRLWPRVDAFGTLETNTNDFSSSPSNHLFGVAARLPFGDPAFFARRAQGAAGLETARRRRESLEDAVRIEVGEAWEAYHGAAAGLPVMKEAASRAEQSLELFRPLYRSGRQSILEVLRAEEGLARARAGHIQNLFQLHAGYLRLTAAAGILGEREIEEVARRLEAAP